MSWLAIYWLATACAAYDGHTYRDLALRYANRMIQDGRDTYGPLPAPLFATTLNRSTYQLFSGEPPIVTGMRARDRAWRGANPAHHMQSSTFCASATTSIPACAKWKNLLRKYGRAFRAGAVRKARLPLDNSWVDAQKLALNKVHSPFDPNLCCIRLRIE